MTATASFPQLVNFNASNLFVCVFPFLIDFLALLFLDNCFLSLLYFLSFFTNFNCDYSFNFPFSLELNIPCFFHLFVSFFSFISPILFPFCRFSPSQYFIFLILESVLDPYVLFGQTTISNPLDPGPSNVWSGSDHANNKKITLSMFLSVQFCFVLFWFFFHPLDSRLRWNPHFPRGIFVLFLFTLFFFLFSLHLTTRK